MNIMSKVFAEKDIEISALYARCVATSNRMNWDLDENEYNDHIFDVSPKFLINKLRKIME